MTALKLNTNDSGTIVINALLLAEQLGGAVAPEAQGAFPSSPALFKEVGPLVDDWERYLRSLAEDMDKQYTDTSTDVSPTQRTQEDDIFLQVH